MRKSDSLSCSWQVGEQAQAWFSPAPNAPCTHGTRAKIIEHDESDPIADPPKLLCPGDQPIPF